MVPEWPIAGQGCDGAWCRVAGRLADCLRSGQGGREEAGRARPATPGRGGRGGHPEDGADLQRVRRADRRQGDGGDPRPGAGVPGGAALRRGHRGEERPAPLHARQARVRGAAPAGQGATIQGPGGSGVRQGQRPGRERQVQSRRGPRAPRQGRNGRAAPEAFGRAAGRTPARLRQRGRESGFRPGRSRVQEVERQHGAGQPEEQHRAGRGRDRRPPRPPSSRRS